MLLRDTVLEVYEGTTWRIRGMVINKGKAKTDLPSDTLSWYLIDNDSDAVLLSVTGASITRNADGTMSFTVSKGTNSSVAADDNQNRYKWQARLVDGNTADEDIVGEGPIIVKKSYS